MLNPRSYTNRYLIKSLINEIKILLLLNSSNMTFKCLRHSSSIYLDNNIVNKSYSKGLL